MTKNALIKQTNALVALTEGLQVKDGQLVVSPQLVEAIEIATSIEKELSEFFGSIKTFLEVQGIPGGEWEGGYLKLSPQRRLYAGDKIKPRFLKTTIDTDEVRHYQKKHNGKLPVGVTEKVSNRLIKKVK